MNRLHNHPLIDTLHQVKGNPRACLFTEPLWGIPFNLYAPFITLYMYALGVQDQQIGLILTIGMVLQVFTAALGGIVTDKYGRRSVTFLIDLVAWSIPTLIWMLAQNFWWFLAAAVFNSLWHITNTSWQCLLVEDTEPRLLVNIYTWVNIAGLLAVFFAPLSTLLVDRFSLVPTVRVLYLLAFVLMTAKFVILYVWSTETAQGTKRMAETKHQSLFFLLLGYQRVFGKVIRSREMRLALVISVIVNITSISITNFFALYITLDVGIPEKYVALFPIGRAVIMLLFMFIIQPLTNRLHYRPVFLTGFTIYLASHVFLLLSRPDSQLLVIVYTLLEAIAFALVVPRRDALGAVFYDKEDRARVMSLIYVIMIAVSSPFGSILGYLSALDRRLPFALNMLLFIVLAVVVATSKVLERQDLQQEA
ncbi:MAG: MFS transporter [Clostridia bacterium]|nr:MFS transporter [Clostridia bacterium]NCC76646.1 MFS transporter [Clostridia bacterium]